jgi:hypothetical protein
MNWSGLASAIRSNNGGVTGIEHILEWITVFVIGIRRNSEKGKAVQSE